MSATTVITVTEQDENPTLPPSKEVKRFSSDNRGISNVGRSSIHENGSVKLGSVAVNEGAPVVSTGNQPPVPSGRQSPHADNQTFDAITPQMRKNEKIIIAAMCFSLFLAGWNDGTIGPLLPRIQEIYGVGYAQFFGGSCG
jgi:hypothetical protein